MLGIILKNYKNENELIKYINNELDKTSVENKIVIVDNSYSKDKHQEFKHRLEQIESRLYNKDLFLITKKDNLGFTRANNFGAQFLSQKFEIKCFLFSNTDIELYDKDVIL
jgi:GT2 family glycosyltransferase